MSYLNAHHSGRYAVAFHIHSSVCVQCRFRNAVDVMHKPDAYCDDGRKLAEEWVRRFELETPPGSTYKLGQPVGSQPYILAEEK